MQDVAESQHGAKSFPCRQLIKGDHWRTFKGSRSCFPPVLLSGERLVKRGALERGAGRGSPGTTGPPHITTSSSTFSPYPAGPWQSLLSSARRPCQHVVSFFLEVHRNLGAQLILFQKIFVRVERRELSPRHRKYLLLTLRRFLFPCLQEVEVR